MLYTGETWVDLTKAPEVARVVGAAQGYKTATTAKLEVFKGPMTLFAMAREAAWQFALVGAVSCHECDTMHATSCPRRG